MSTPASVVDKGLVLLCSTAFYSKILYCIQLSLFPLTETPPPDILPRPMNVEVFQNGLGSVNISWTIADSNMDFLIDVCYTTAGSGSEMCLSNRLSKTIMSTNITELENNIEYTFKVYSVDDNGNREGSTEMIVAVQPCSGGMKRSMDVNVDGYASVRGGGGRRRRA